VLAADFHRPGGAGLDYVSFADASAAVGLHLGAGGEVGDAAGDAYFSIERATGSVFHDAIAGAGGSETLSGNLGDDSLDGGGGGDLLNGQSGADILIGGLGDDTLDGGVGADALTGGQGEDRFEFRAAGGADEITDFTPGPGLSDVIRIVGLGARFDTFDEIIAAAVEEDADTIINFGGGDMLVLVGVLKAQLAPDDFLYG
jgi:Ca2+-binding RTX toxin-like protein